MKRLSLVLLLLVLCILGAQSQDRKFTPGGVWRINYYNLKSAQSSDYGEWLREHGIPILDEMKRQGLILDYKFFSKTSDASNDWNIAEAIVYRNYADALDYNEDRSKKIQSIHTKHFGSEETARTSIEQHNQMRELIFSQMMKEQISTQ